ncbi:hypothetical protein JAO73_10390 [Hymenobacter sp. BT523]|uniref:hypothetical protein n=1 Tax=Hymenobacter sp. BT523 TaxID=2795725 RepID=UPI0018EBA038|nr:hypothetical protein [Hymenobacter sp. BT523]MBJ6109423.1 hypothetical protein [Hymenobacter sp. BT523]
MAENKEKRTIEIIVNGQQANASLKEMNAAAAVLYSQFQKMSKDDPGRAKLVADYRAMKDRIAEVKTELTGVSQNAGIMKQAFANAFALFTGGGILGVVQQVWGFFMASKEEALASAKSSADLEATLRSTGQAAGLTADQIRKIGEERAKVTLFDDDETNRASAMLLTFTNIKKGVFEDAIPAIQDLATKMGGDGPADMKGASIQLGKALNDPIKGITALTRVGITFSEQQKEQITQMVKAGNTAGAQKLILAELNKEFGGSAEAARKAGGGMATLSMRWAEMKETVGGFVNEGLTTLSQWLGKVLDNSEPIVDLFVELGAEVASLWHDVSDLVEGLGLFDEKGGSAAFVAGLLKGAITLLVAPLRVCAAVMHAIIDGFVDWYNKSEMLRGVLGGLGAMVVSVFTTIKDDALKILGGVGDILIGIFSLDKNKIIAGFRSALAGTADLALESGQKAAKAFLDGYEANKGNHITRTVRVEAEDSSADAGGTAAGAGESSGGESAKEKAAREAKEKKRLAALAKQHKAEVEAAIKHEEMLLNLEEAALIARGTQRERELGAIDLDAKRRALKVTGTAQEQAAATQIIYQEAQLKKQELQAKFDDEDRKQAEQHLADLLADEEAAEVEREADLQAKFEDALLSQQQRDQLLYEAKHASLEAKLALEEQYADKTSQLYRATFKELEKLERDKNREDLAEAKRMQKAKWDLAQLSVKTAGDVVQTTIDLLFQDEAARKKHHNVYTALSGAKIIMDGVQEVAAIWRYAAENPANGLTGGVAGAVIGGIQTALAVARTAYGLTRLQEFSFAKGGRTGGGEGLAVSPMGQLLELSGMRIGANGKLDDGSGFAVAGVVHENEYVIPAWLRQDPQVAAFENWVEAKRLRGFYEGGPTGGPMARASVDEVFGGLGSDGASTAELLGAMLGELRTMNGRLAGVENWQSRFEVVLDVNGHQRVSEERKQVQFENGIRA